MLTTENEKIARDKAIHVCIQKKNPALKVRPKNPNSILKKGIWLYFLLLIFEGALRKWVLPQLAAPLLIIRDPVAIWLIFLANRRGLFPFNRYLLGMVVLGFLSMTATMLVGHGNLYVALYGTRILVLHFPLIFVIGRIFDRADIIRIGKFTLILTAPMALLIAVQFYSPQSAWINKAVGGLEGGGFSGALNFYRPPATFSFTNGTTLFFGFSALFVFYFWINPKGINKLILIFATVGLIMSIPLSISRTLLFQVVICLLFVVIAMSRKPENVGKLIVAFFGGFLILFVLSKTSFFQTATEAFTSRFETATESEGGLEGVLGDRYLGGMIKSIVGASDQPFFGYGIGLGTNVGGSIISGKATTIIYGEDEWARLTGEMGALLGLFAIFIRLSLSVQVAFESYKKLVAGDLLPWILLSLFLTNIPQGQWGQPTSLGFSIVIGGFTIAALKTPPRKPRRPKIVVQGNKNAIEAKL